MEQGEFRKDLFFRLNVVPLYIPPLRERREDIAPLVKMLLARFAERYQSPLPEVSPGAMRIIEEHDWDGNIRELENVLERSFSFADDHMIQYIGLDLVPRLSAETKGPVDLRELKRKAADDVERRILQEQLNQANGDVRAVADALDMTPRAVYQKLSYHGFNHGRKAGANAGSPDDAEQQVY